MASHHQPLHATHPLRIAQQAAYVGGASAIPGLITGAVYGTLRTRTPVLFSIVSGAQCFAIGTTFWAVRTSILDHTGLLNWWDLSRGTPIRVRHQPDPSLDDKIRASTIAGASTGFTLGFLFRGPRNVIPGTLMFSLFGWAGQHGYNYLDARNTRKIQEKAELKAMGVDEPKESLLHRFAKSKWSPMSILSDEEHVKMIQEKILYVEAEIAMIDDRIAEYRKKAGESKVQEAGKTQEAPTSHKK